LAKSSSSLNIKNNGFAFACLALLILVVYSNTFHASWQFDDKPNIIDNYYLHLKDLQPQSLMNTFFTQPTNPWESGNQLYRPIACLTFALNWYFGKDDVTGYHAVNLGIHLLTAFLLFLTILNLCRTPNLRDKFNDSVYVIALLTAAMWAVHPIQTQAVTYIVQRMASLATLFYVLGMLFYIKCRASGTSLHRILLLLGCILAFLFALGSKENTATLPAALLLVEISCFQDLGVQRTKWAFVGGSIIGGLLLIIINVWLFLPENPVAFIKNYDYRPFSLGERLLTEPRIVLFYLSLIFYPHPARLSIEHDVTISTALFQPWTTLPAILLTAALIGIGFSQIRKRPLIALAILFFYLNHTIESTIFPLELIFEHRNYLPSLFLFLPVAAGFLKLVSYDRVTNTAMRGSLFACIVVLIIALGLGTYMRNRVWATEISLWQDAMHKAPNSARPLAILAWQMAYGPNANASQYDAALKIYEKALLLKKTRSFSEPTIMDNIAGIYFKKGQHQKAIDLLEQALAISPNYAKGRYDLIQILITLGRWDAASEHADILLSKHPDHEGYLNTKGLISLYRKNYDEAIACFHKSLSVAPLFKTTWIGLGVAYSLNGNYAIAENTLRRAHQLPPQDMVALLGLIENSRRAGDILQARRYADKLLNIYDKAAINEQLYHLSNNPLLPPLSPEFISQIIEGRLKENS
jgi:tetratricopeptide (TPR) repeat protein